MALRSPLNVHWELTNLCNLRCVHCYQQDDGPRGRLPAADTLCTIAQRIVDAGVFEVTLTGGEVLLVPQLREIVAFLNSHGIRPHITSNGMLVTDAIADWMAQLKLTFQVSIDAADPERHNSVRQSPRAYEAALAGVRRLVEHGVEVSFAYTAMRGNTDDFEAVVALAERSGVTRVCVGEVLPEYGTQDVQRRLRLSPEIFTAFAAELDTVKDAYAGRVDVAVALLSGHRFDTRLREAPCTALERDLAILYDGWAYPCPFVRDVSQRLGNVIHEPIEDIWTGAAAARFRAEKTTRSTKHCVTTPLGPRPVAVAIQPRPSTALI
jgi:radical SAM protein with 4Fe4S-binding SPASM domain